MDRAVMDRAAMVRAVMRSRSTENSKARKLVALLCALLLLGSCAGQGKRSGLPAQAQAAIETASEDLDQERYDKLYREAAPEWRSANTPEQSAAALRSLKERLGGVKSRSYQTATEQQRAGGGDAAIHSLVVTYYTTFERGEGMETFTLIEREGQWQLARYFVNSNALKP